MWGVQMTLGRLMSGVSGLGGSDSKTSTPAAAIAPDSSGVNQRRFVDDRAARDVDQRGCGFHPRQQVGVHEVVGAGRVGQVDRDDVALLEGLVQVHQFHAQALGFPGRDGGRVGDAAGAEGLGAHGHGAADPTQADQGQGAGAHVADVVDAAFPLRDVAVPRLPLVEDSRDATHRSQDQVQRGVRRLLGGEGGNVAHHHPGRRGGLDVHVVHAHGRRDDAQQVGQVVERMQAVVTVRIDDALVAGKTLHGFLVAGRRRHHVQRGANGVQRLAVFNDPLVAQAVGQGNAERIVGHLRAAPHGQVAEP